MPHHPVASPWWGEFRFSPGQTRCWRFGPLTLSVQRLAHEWQLFHQVREDWVESDYEVEVDAAAAPLGGDAALDRFVCRGTSKALQVLPGLADRPVVTRPATPVHLPSGEEVTFYVSSPVWIRLGIPSPLRWLLELPLQRPSDTWFGPSTREGELCYAARTSARLQLEEIPLRPHRALTPVSILNQGDEPLLLERLKLPVPCLSLYGSADGLLWTESLSIIREQDLRMAALRIGKGPPSPAGTARLVSEAREPVEQGILVRALHAIFG